LPTLYPDRIEGAAARTGADGHIVRAMFVDDLDTSGDPAAVLVRAVAVPGMPQRGDRHPTVPQLECVFHDARPTGDSQAVVLVYYASNLPPTQGGMDETLVIRDTTTLMQETTQLLPPQMGLKQLLVALESGNASGNTGPNPDTHTVKTATVSYPVPLRNRVLTGVFRSRRPDSWRQCVRKVNDRQFLDLDTGYWLCTYYDEQWDNVSKKYRVTIAFTTKGEEDWSTYWVARLPSGEYHAVPQATTNALRQQRYASGIRNAFNGILKVGLYQLAPFERLFGSLIKDPTAPSQFNGNGNW
jgi:hypothetical protein